MASADHLQEQLSQLFGSYKAEWLKGEIYELFTQPSYFPELTTTRSCVLIGGRGTGKTTVLRGLSFQGQYALSGRSPASIPGWTWYGLYYRVNTNHVTAFSGIELTEGEWTPLFAHYFNILLCDLVLEFLEWFEQATGSQISLPEKTCTQLCLSLHLPPCQKHRELRDALELSRISFEAYINNVVDADLPPLSLQSVPVDLLTGAVLSLPEFHDKQFFFLLDEYENFLDYQQQVVNTIVKHSEGRYCFKIGVRELGWRCRSTLNSNEQLVHPADYARIHIVEKLQGETFKRFAFDVCMKRIARIDLQGQGVLRDIELLLPGMTEEEEALRLGVEPIAKQIFADIKRESGDSFSQALCRMHPLEIFLVKYWAETKGVSLAAVMAEAIAHPSEWKTRYGNYRYALLYTIRQGKRGIHKSV